MAAILAALRVTRGVLTRKYIAADGVEREGAEEEERGRESREDSSRGKMVRAEPTWDLHP